MAEEVFAIKGTVTADTSKACSDLDKLDSKVNSSGKTFSKFCDGMASVGKTLTAAITVPMVALGKKSIEMASDLTEAMNKSSVVFGEYADEVEAWSKTLVKSHGTTQQSALEFASTMGSMMQQMGLTRKESMSWGKTLTELSADLASFNNSSVSEAQTAIRAAISGETEPLKKYGIVMTEVNLQEYARAKGIKKTYKEMSQQEKTQLRLNYLMEKSKLANGDFARTNTSLANATRVLQAQFETFLTRAAKLFEPTVTKIVNKMVEWMDKINNLSDGQIKLISAIAGFVTVIPPVLLLLGKLGKGLGAISKFAGISVSGLLGLGAIIGVVVGAIFLGLNKDAQEGFKNFVNSAKEGIVNFADEFVKNAPMIESKGLEIITKLCSGLTKGLPMLISGAGEIIGSLLIGLARMLNTLAETGVSLITSLLNGITSSFPSLNVAFDGLCSNIVEGLTILLPQLPTVAQTLIDGLVTNLNLNLPKVVDFVIGLGQTIIDTVITLLPTLVDTGITLFKSLLEGFINAMPSIGEAVMTLILQIGLWILENLPTLIEEGGRLVNGLIDGVQENIPKFLDKAVEMLDRMVNKIIEYLPKLIPAALRLISTLCDGLTRGIPKLLSKAGELIGTLIRGLISKLPDIIAAGLRLLVALVKGLWDNRQQLFTAASKLIGLLPSMLKGAIKGLVSIGGSIVDSFIQGVSNCWGRFTTWLSNKISSIPIVGKLFKALSGGGGGDDAEEHAAGGVFKQATLLPSINGNSHIVGEAGAEAITPLSWLSKEMQKNTIATINAILGDGATVGKGVEQNNTFVFNNTVDDPIETARRIERTQRKLVEQLA